MTFYLRLKKEEKTKLLTSWKILSQKYQKLNYKPTEATEPQLDYILALSRKLDRREASVLIALLQLLNSVKDKEQADQ